MKNTMRLSWKMFRRNKLLNTYIVIQMAFVFAMSIFMTSSLTSRFEYYSPFKELIEKEGYFCELSPETNILGGWVSKASDLSDGLGSVEENDVNATYKLNLSKKVINAAETGADVSVLTFAYDDLLYKKWTPKMSEGKWLSELSDDSIGEIPVVVYDMDDKINVGDVIETYCMDYSAIPDENPNPTEKNVTLKVVGILDHDAEVVYNNIRNDKDCRDIFMSPEKILDIMGNTTIYFCKNSDALSNDVFGMSWGPAFINTEKITDDNVKAENDRIIRSISRNYIELPDFRQNSKVYITEEIKKLLPIFICILLLTIIITISVNAITTYKEVKNFALYYICGITWKKTMLISLCHAVIQTAISLGLAIVSMLICNALNVFSKTVFEFSILHVLVCGAMIIVNLIFAFIMPAIIIRSNTPKEILTSD